MTTEVVVEDFDLMPTPSTVGIQPRKVSLRITRRRKLKDMELRHVFSRTSPLFKTFCSYVYIFVQMTAVAQ